MKFKAETLNSKGLQILRESLTSNKVVGLLTQTNGVIHCRIEEFGGKGIRVSPIALDQIEKHNAVEIETKDIIAYFPSVLEPISSMANLPSIEFGTYAFGPLAFPSSVHINALLQTNRHLLRDKPLYVDWNWLHRASGGIRSIGGGFIVSGSVGWENSLFSFFWNKLNRLHRLTGQDIAKGDIPSEFCLKATSVRLYINKKWRLQMEGEDWFKGKSVLEDETVLPCYFKAGDSFLYPLKWLNMIPGPFTLWGDMMPAGRYLQVMGVRKPYFIRVRGMATA